MLEDLRTNSELAFAWLFQEYANLRGYIPQFMEEEVSIDRYDSLLCAMLDSLLTRADQRDGYVWTDSFDSKQLFLRVMQWAHLIIVCVAPCVDLAHAIKVKFWLMCVNNLRICAYFTLFDE